MCVCVNARAFLRVWLSTDPTGMPVWETCARGASLCSRLVGMGPATSICRGPATISLMSDPQFVRLFTSLKKEAVRCIPDRYRIKLWTSNLAAQFKLHVDRTWDPELSAIVEAVLKEHGLGRSCAVEPTIRLARGSAKASALS